MVVLSTGLNKTYHPNEDSRGGRSEAEAMCGLQYLCSVLLQKPKTALKERMSTIVEHTYNGSILGQRQEDHELQASLNYIASLRPTWAI